MSQQPSPNWWNRLYIWACQLLYHQLAPVYDVVSWMVSLGRWEQWRRVALKYLPPLGLGRQRRVLELGFGTGHLLLDLALVRRARSQPRLHAVGLELSPAMHRVAARRMRRHGLTIGRVRAPAQQMPFADESFDAIVSTFPASYIFDPATLRECRRVLRRNGSDHAGLVIVGAWVSLRRDSLRRLPLPFYGTPDAEIIRAIERRLVAAGFRVTFVDHTDGWAQIGVILATPQEH